MRKPLMTLLAGAALATLGGAASAQLPYDYGYGVGQTATLYELPNFLGRSVVVTGENTNLSGIGFNDRARSARLQGVWSVCADAGFRGHCETLSGNVAFMPPGLEASASSLRATVAGGIPGIPGFPGYPGGGWGGTGTATLYEFPNFQGRSVVVTREEGNLSNVGFNDRARSARFEGTWRVCEDASYRGRCETFVGSVPNLSLRISGVSSLQMTGGPGGYPGYPGGGQGVEGRSVVFYAGAVGSTYGSPYGQYRGTRRAADDFCRQMGHRNSVYFDPAGGDLSDVLCRR